MTRPPWALPVPCSGGGNGLPLGQEWGGCVSLSLSLSLLHFFVNLMMNLCYHTFPFSYTPYLLKEEVPLNW